MKSKTPTKAESRRMLLIKTIGCIICGSAPCHCHHLLSGGVRRGHMFTLGLCDSHHEGIGEHQDFVSYHGRHKQFNIDHGTDDELLELQNELLAETGKWIVR